MKKIPLLILFILTNFQVLNAQGRLLNQKFSIELSNVLLEDVLYEITNQSNANFAYNSRIIEPEKRITIRAKNETLQQILETITEYYNLEYSVVRRQIILRPAPEKEKPLKSYTVSGIIKDMNTGETLPGATVWAHNTASGTISNQYGFYSLTLPEGIYDLNFSFVGFSRENMEVIFDRNKNLNMELELNTETLGEVTITVNEKVEQIQKSQMSHIIVNPMSMQAMPEFAGEVGLIRNLQSLPGIKTHSDGSAFFFVRGGNKDQNLILIDEAPVFNPAHLFGYYSVIIPETAKDITIYKGDFPIEKGGRLSSVIDVQTKDGNMKRFGLDGVINPLMSRLALEGPIVRNKSSVYTSVRRSNFNWIYRETAPNVDLHILDLNFKINWSINNKNRVYYSLFHGRDNYTNHTGNTGIRWYNGTSTLRWSHIFNSRLFANATLYGSTYNYNLLVGQGIKWESEIRNISLRYDLSYFPNPELTYKFGLSRSQHELNPGNLMGLEENPYIPRLTVGKASKTLLYFSRENQLNDRWSWKAAIRLPLWHHTGPARIYSFNEKYQVVDTLLYQENESIKGFLNLSPALSVRYRVGENASFKFSHSINHQYLHLLSSSISPFSSFEIWVPSGANIKPQRAHQTAIGFNLYLPSVKLEIIPEMYYKKMFNQLDYVPHANLILNPLFHSQLRFGQARSYGMELLLRRTEGRLTGWLSYTWSRVFNQFDELNHGKEFPAFYDRPHDVSVFLNYHLGKRVNISANWTYQTGSAITTPIGFYEYNGSKVPIYGTRNNDRLPDYHRLDLSLAWTLNQPGNRFNHSLNFGIYNFYNRHNPVSINFNKVKTKDGNFVVPANLYGSHEILSTQKYLLGIMPSISYRFGL
jgi:hypothetical protein